MSKIKAKIVTVSDDDYAIQFSPETLEELNWKEGDEIQFEETADSLKLSRKITIKAELDDKAFDVGNFIQQLAEVQDEKFEALWQECKEKEWIKGMDEENAKDWLFDYIYNGWEKDSDGFEKTFSEYVICD